MKAIDAIQTPNVPAPENFTDAAAAVARLIEIYKISAEFLCQQFSDAIGGAKPPSRIRAFYPEIRMTTTSFAKSTAA